MMSSGISPALGKYIRVHGQLSEEHHQVFTPEKAEYNFNLVSGKITEIFFPSRAMAIFASLMGNRRWP